MTCIFLEREFSLINIRLQVEGWFFPTDLGADSSDSNSMIYTASGMALGPRVPYWVQERALLRIYCTVTDIVVECGAPPTSPHAAGRIVVTSMRTHSAQSIRRFLSKLVANMKPSNPSDTQAA